MRAETNRYFVLAAVIGGVVLAGCSSEKPFQKPESTPQKAIPVQIVQAMETELPGVYEATGTVRASATAIVSAKMMGYVRDVKASLGDQVREGQPLVTIDAREVETAIRRAEAAREEVKSAIPEADAGIAAAKANADLAQATFRRMQDLFNKKSISNQEFDEVSERVKAADAAYEMARAKRIQLDAKLAQAEQEIRAAEINRGYAEVTAPFAGVITAKSVEPGTLATPGAPLFTMERNDLFRLEASVEESRLGRIRVGQTVAVEVEGAGRLNGKVSEMVPSVDSSARTGTVKIDLPVKGGLRSGVFGRALFPAEAKKAVTVPATAVEERGQLQSVFVIDNGTARNRLVTCGIRIGSRVEILSGLSVGEKIASSIPAGLNDGVPVEVRP